MASGAETYCYWTMLALDRHVRPGQSLNSLLSCVGGHAEYPPPNGHRTAIHFCPEEPHPAYLLQRTDLSLRVACLVAVAH